MAKTSIPFHCRQYQKNKALLNGTNIYVRKEEDPNFNEKSYFIKKKKKKEDFTKFGSMYPPQMLKVNGKSLLEIASP